MFCFVALWNFLYMHNGKVGWGIGITVIHQGYI